MGWVWIGIAAPALLIYALIRGGLMEPWREWRRSRRKWRLLSEVLDDPDFMGTIDPDSIGEIRRYLDRIAPR